MRFLSVTPAGEVPVTLFRRRPGGTLFAYAYLSGQRLRKDTGERSEPRARAVAERMVREAAGAAKPTGLTWQGVIQDYLAALQTGILDRRSQRHRLEAVAASLQGPVPPTVEQARDEIGRWLAGRAVGGWTLRNYRVALSRLAAWLIRERRVPWLSNPAAASLHTRPRLVNRAPAVPAEADVRRLLDGARATDLYPVLVLVLSGLRPGAACRCTWEQVTPAGVRVLEKGRERTVPLSGWARKALDERRRAVSRDGVHATGPIYVSACPRMAQRELALLRQILGLPAGLGLQSLRRAADQRLYQSGAAPQLAAQILGHSPATAVRHYVDWRGLDAGDAAKALDWSGGSPGEVRGKKRGT
jgi:integrase